MAMNLQKHLNRNSLLLFLSVLFSTIVISRYEFRMFETVTPRQKLIDTMTLYSPGLLYTIGVQFLLFQKQTYLKVMAFPMLSFLLWVASVGIAFYISGLTFVPLIGGVSAILFFLLIKVFMMNGKINYLRVFFTGAMPTAAITILFSLAQYFDWAWLSVPVGAMMAMYVFVWQTAISWKIYLDYCTLEPVVQTVNKKQKKGSDKIKKSRV